MSHSIRANRDPAGFVVELGGDVDAAAADDLAAALATAADGSAPTVLVIVELSAATMLDSRSIGILAEWQARIRSDGGRLALVGARPEVRRLFTLIGLEETFEFFATVESARAS